MGDLLQTGKGLMTLCLRKRNSRYRGQKRERSARRDGSAGNSHVKPSTDDPRGLVSYSRMKSEVQGRNRAKRQQRPSLHLVMEVVVSEAAVEMQGWGGETYAASSHLSSDIYMALRNAGGAR